SSCRWLWIPSGAELSPSLARPEGNVTGTSFMAPRPGREAVRSFQRGSSYDLSGGPPSVADQSGGRGLLARGGGCGSDLAGASSNPGRAESPGDRYCLHSDDEGVGGPDDAATRPACDGGT